MTSRLGASTTSSSTRGCEDWSLLQNPGEQIRRESGDDADRDSIRARVEATSHRLEYQRFVQYAQCLFVRQSAPAE